MLHQLLITWQCRVNKCWGSVLEHVRCAKHAKHVTSALDTGMLSEGSSFFAGGCNRWFQLMGKSCRVYFGKTFACSVIFLFMFSMQMHASLKLAMRSSEITRSSSKRDVVVNTTERSSDRTWQTRHPCGGKKNLPWKVSEPWLPFFFRWVWIDSYVSNYGPWF